MSDLDILSEKKNHQVLLDSNEFDKQIDKPALANEIESLPISINTEERVDAKIQKIESLRQVMSSKNLNKKNETYSMLKVTNLEFPFNIKTQGAFNLEKQIDLVKNDNIPIEKRSKSQKRPMTAIRMVNIQQGVDIFNNATIYI